MPGHDDSLFLSAASVVGSVPLPAPTGVEPGFLIDALHTRARHANMLLTGAGIVRDVNRFSLDYTGFRWEDVVGVPFWETPWLRDCPEGALLARRAVQQATSTGCETTVEDLPYDVCSGERHHVIARFLPVEEIDGIPGPVLVTCYDTTRRRRAEAALQAERNHQAALLDGLRDGLIETDRDGRVMAVSEQFCGMTGQRRDDLVGQHAPYPWSVPGELDPVASAIREVLAGGAAYLEGQISGPAGGRLFVEVSASPVRLPEGTLVGFAALVRDITERVGAAERLRRAEQETVLAEEQERIARDLQDRTLQRLFATGLAVQGAAQRVREPVVTARLEEVVSDLDDAIRDIRRVIFGLAAPPGGDGGR